MARKPLRPLIRSGGFYPSIKWTPLAYAGGYTTANGGEEPAPPPIEKTVTGNPIHILDALAKPVQALSVKLEPIQDLNGYDNPWPAGGGKNLLDPSQRTTTNVNAYFYRDTGFLLKAGVTYTFSVYSSAVTAGIYFHKFGTVDNLAVKYNAKSVTYTPTEDVMAWFDAYWVSDPQEGTANIDAQLELGSTATAWTPYSNICPISGHTDADVIVSPTLNPLDGTTYPIPLGQTVYGGTLEYVRNGDSVSLRFVADRAMVDLGTLNWSYGVASYTYYYASAPGGKLGVQTNGICSAYKFTELGPSSATMYSVSVGNPYISTGYCGIAVKDDRYAGDVAAFKAAMSGVQLVYKLAEPVIIPLTLDTPIELLEGENNIWSDGEMTLVYLADGNASDVEALNILLGGRYVNNHGEDEPSDREALDILLGRTR